MHVVILYAGYPTAVVLNTGDAKPSTVLRLWHNWRGTPEANRSAYKAEAAPGVAFKAVKEGQP